MKVQLPEVGSRWIAIQKHGGKIHAAHGANGSTIGRSWCDHRIHGRIVTGEREMTSVCERCAHFLGAQSDSPFRSGGQS